MQDIKLRHHAEATIDGFTKYDGTIKFYSFVRAIMLRTSPRSVMDFGAGRGQAFQDEGEIKSYLVRDLMDLRKTGATVWAADIDPIVKTHQASDHQMLLQIGQPLPFEDDFFDVIVSDMTFEHIEQPDVIAAELWRVLKPGGTICARTPNKYGYVAIASRLVPNKHHVVTLQHVMPDREAQDVFPTVYKMNRVNTVRRLFPQAEFAWYRDSAEPSYHFNSNILYQALLLLHKLLPNALATSLCLFLTKPDPAAAPDPPVRPKPMPVMR